MHACINCMYLVKGCLLDKDRVAVKMSVYVWSATFIYIVLVDNVLC